jgi:hypothetical protein
MKSKKLFKSNRCHAAEYLPVISNRACRRGDPQDPNGAAALDRFVALLLAMTVPAGWGLQMPGARIGAV